MPRPRPQIWILLAAVLALGGSYAIAQQPQGSAPKPAAGAAPKEAAHKGHEAMHEGHEGMHGGMHEGHEGMHGGMHEEMEGRGCPLEQAGPIASVKVEKTDTGAVIRLTAKNPADVQKLQHMAEMMAEHMGAAAGPHKEAAPGAAGAQKPAAPGTAAGQHKDVAPKKEAVKP